jgi:hypothetical protein
MSSSLNITPLPHFYADVPAAIPAKRKKTGKKEPTHRRGAHVHGMFWKEVLR